MKKNRINLKNVATIVACFAVCMMLVFSGCKKEKDNKNDPGGGGGGGTGKLSPPAWIQGNWIHKESGMVYKFTSNSILVGNSYSSGGENLGDVLFKNISQQVEGFKFTQKETTKNNNLYELTYNVTANGMKPASYIYFFKKGDGSFIEMGGGLVGGPSGLVMKLDKTDDGGGGGGGGNDELKGIAFNTMEITIKEGESYNLTLMPVPSTAKLPKCNFSSDDKNIATVNSTGKVTAVSAGETIIRATTEDGKFWAGCAVIVTDDGGGGGGGGEGDFTYKDPYLKFGDNMDAVKNYETRTLEEEDDVELWYKGENSDVKYVNYYFEYNQLLEVYVLLNQSSNIETRAKSFLSKKYKYIGKDENGFHIFLTSDEKMVVVLYYYDGYGWNIAYGENTGEKSAKMNKRKIRQASTILK